MAIYPFKCRTCGATKDIQAPVGSDVDRPFCAAADSHGRMARLYSFTARPIEEGGFNPAAGRYVKNRADLKSALSEKNDSIYRRNGIESDMRPTDLREIAARSIDGETLERLQREHRDNGNPGGAFPAALTDAVEKGV